MSEQAIVTTGLPPAAAAELRRAMRQLESGGGLVVRMADLMGAALERSVSAGARTIGVPPGVQEAVSGLAAAALRRAFDIAVLRLRVADADREPAPEVTRAVVLMSGAVGGFLGLGGFFPDVAVTTLAIMRSIARIAQENGEDLADEDTRRACLEVFALTPPAAAGGRPEWSYLSSRFLLQGRPMVMLLSEVAGRYGVTLSQKLALQAVPFLGAVGGATLNTVFLQHYKKVARSHFTVRRLERLHGSAAIRAAWPAAALEGA